MQIAALLSDLKSLSAGVRPRLSRVLLSVSPFNHSLVLLLRWRPRFTGGPA
jgi:hypothetical protein